MDRGCALVMDRGCACCHGPNGHQPLLLFISVKLLLYTLHYYYCTLSLDTVINVNHYCCCYCAILCTFHDRYCGTYVYTFIICNHLLNCVYCDFVDLLCTCDIYCTSVRPGRGIPPLRLFLRFLPLFFPVKRVFLWASFSSCESRV